MAVLDDLKDTLEKGKKKKEEKVTKNFSSMGDRLKAVEAVTAALNKQFDTKVSIVRLGDKVNVPIPHIPSNIITLDKYVLQCGGLPRGKIIEVIGPESSGKTTIALHMIAQEQKAGGLVSFVDAEHALDPTWASKLGVDVDNLLVSQPDSGEQALETVEALVESQAVTLIVVDSVAALVPQAELDGEMGDSFMGLQARLMSQAMRKLRGKCSMNGIPVIFINQIREKIGVMFGSPETTPGGRALKFYSSVRLDVRRASALKEGDNFIGHIMKIKTIKNKCGAPFRETLVDLYYDSGIDTFGNFVDYAVDQKIIEKSGAWYNYKTDRIGQGRANVSNFLKDNPDMVESIKKDLANLEAIENKGKENLTKALEDVKV